MKSYVSLERYAEKYKIEDKTNFYLAKDGAIKSGDNNQILSKVFETLSQPYSVFDKMDAEKLQ
jgi:hypothetical protein